MSNRGRSVVATILIVLGVAFLLDQLQIASFLGINSFVAVAWPLILIILGVWLLSRRNMVGGWILLALGSIFFISTTTHLDAFGILWPLILIVLGLSLLYRRTTNITPAQWEATTTETADVIDENAIFSGIRRSVHSKNFRGGSVTVVFGGAEIDLSEITVASSGATIQVNAIFGGASIRIPKHCRVVSNGTPILGGWDNQYTTENGENLPVLKITGSAIFGGVDVKN